MKDIISESFEPVYGQLCWGVTYYRMTNLSMNFGTPRLEVVREPQERKSRDPLIRRIGRRRHVSVTGRWSLWVYLSYWKICYKGHEATSGSSLRKIGGATGDIEGQRLVNVEVDRETGATRFSFDLGGTLAVRRRERDCDDELWILRKPSGYFLSVRANGNYDHVPGCGKRRGVRGRQLPVMRKETP